MATGGTSESRSSIPTGTTLATRWEAFHRVESVARLSEGALRVLDLTDEAVRKAVKSAEDAEVLYRSELAANY